MRQEGVSTYHWCRNNKVKLWNKIAVHLKWKEVLINQYAPPVFFFSGIWPAVFTLFYCHVIRDSRLLERFIYSCSHTTNAASILNTWSRSIPFVNTLISLNCPLCLNIILCNMLVMMESLSGCQLSPGGRQWGCYYAGSALWLLSWDRKACLVGQRGTTIRFVDCSTRWLVEIRKWSTLISAARQLMWSYIFWHIPSMTYYWWTRKSVWSLLALCSRQMRDTLRGVLSSKGLCKYFTISLLHSWIIYSAAWGWMSLMTEWDVSFVYSYLSDTNLLFFFIHNSNIFIVIQLHSSQCFLFFFSCLNVATADRYIRLKTDWKNGWFAQLGKT